MKRTGQKASLEVWVMAEMGSPKCALAKGGRFNLMKDLKYSTDHNQNNIRAERLCCWHKQIICRVCIVFADLTKNTRGKIVLVW